MDFLDSIFSFVPLLMVILFVMRIVKTNKKRKESKPDSTAPEPGKSVKSGKKREGRLESLVDEGLVRIQQHFDKAAEGVFKTVEDSPEQPIEAPPAPVIQPERYPEQKSIGALKTAKAADAQKKTAIASTSPVSSPSRSRLDSLPELKKAVVWAEILGKPKGLE